jgi:hypothetical protein
MIKFRYFILLLFISISCKDNYDKYIENIDTSKSDSSLLDSTSTEILAGVGTYYIPVKVSENSQKNDLIISNVFLYYFVYKKHYQNEYENFTVFLRDVFSNKLIFPKSIVNGRIVNKNDIIFQDYKKNGLDFIIDKYLVKVGTYYKSSYDLDWENQPSLIKILFEHKFYISKDDISGRLVVSKNAHN